MAFKVFRRLWVSRARRKAIHFQKVFCLLYFRRLTFAIVYKERKMADFNKILTPGDVDGGIINVVNEIPAGSNHKIEWNRKLAAFQLDRVEPSIFSKPTNYGFIPQTLEFNYLYFKQFKITGQSIILSISNGLFCHLSNIC